METHSHSGTGEAHHLLARAAARDHEAFGPLMRFDLAALEALIEDTRVVVLLADAEDLPMREVTAILGVPLGTVKSCPFRGRRQLAQRLGGSAAGTNAPTCGVA